MNGYNPAMVEFSLAQKIAVWVFPVLSAIILHEVAHGWAARYLGDPTAMMLGRLSLNPLKHVDPLGTVLVPLVLLLLPTTWLFGWAKPVPVTQENLRQPRRDMALVAVAGPVANLVMALFWVLVLKLGVAWQGSGSAGLFLMAIGVAGALFNVVLGVLNLLPVPPLDGGRILMSALPGPMAWRLSRVEPYGLVVLVLLLVTVLSGLGVWLWRMALWLMTSAGVPGEHIYSVVFRLGLLGG